MSALLAGLMGSAATFAVIHTLATSGEAVSLRQLAARTQLAVRSIQVATAKLVAIGMLRREVRGNCVLFSIAESSELLGPLRTLFAVDSEIELMRRAEEWSKRSRGVLERIQDLNETLTTLRNRNR